MAYNSEIRTWVKRQLGESAVTPEGPAGGREDEPVFKNPILRPTKFRTGVLSLLLSDKIDVDNVRVHIVSQCVGDARQTFNRLDSSGDGFIDKDEVSKLLQGVGVPNSAENVSQYIQEIDGKAGGTVDGRLSFEEFKAWYMDSEARIEVGLVRVLYNATLVTILSPHPPTHTCARTTTATTHKLQSNCHTAFIRIDRSGDGFIDRSEIRSVIQLMDINASEADVDKAMEEFDATKNDKLDYNEFSRWYRQSMLFEMHKKQNAEDDDEEEPLDVSFPDDTRGRVGWILMSPILIPLWCTVPDVRNAGRENWYMPGFFGSIIWIGIYSCECKLE